MSILIIQHEDGSRPGTTLEWLQDENISYRVVRADQGFFPAPDDYQGLIILGGEMNVDQEERYPWLKIEKAYIKSWLNTEKPVLGICLGAQLVAEILGARVSRHSFWEIGWSDVEVLGDSGFPQAGESIPAFQWHGYSFDIPDGAQRVLQGRHWPHQGFRFKSVLATQFHPETDADFVRECAEAQSEKTQFSESVLSSQQIMERIKDVQVLKSWYFKTLKSHFLKR